MLNMPARLIIWFKEVKIFAIHLCSRMFDKNDTLRLCFSFVWRAQLKVKITVLKNFGRKTPFWKPHVTRLRKGYHAKCFLQIVWNFQGQLFCKNLPAVASGYFMVLYKLTSHPAFTCSNLTIDTLKQGVKYVQNMVWNTPMASVWCLYC